MKNFSKIAIAGLVTAMTVTVAPAAQALDFGGSSASSVFSLSSNLSPAPSPAPAPAPNPSPAPAPNPDTNTNTNTDAESKEVFAKINEYRASRGLKPVAYSQSLADQAQIWADHLKSEGGDKIYHMPNLGYFETIALGRGGTNTPVEQWKNSAPHNAILLNPNVGSGGVGRVQVGPNRYITIFRGTF